MEILNVRTARSIWLFDARDLYHFLVWPKNPEELSWTTSSAKGIKFVDGSFSMENQLRSVSVTFYNDGIIADTGSTTRHADIFLDDILGFAAHHFGVQYRPDLVHKKLYVSELIVRPKYDLSAMCDKIGRVAAALNAISPGPELQWFGFELRPDPRPDSGDKPSFRFEREIGMPAAHNRYYSLAHLTTENHAQLLNDFEGIMAA